MYGLNNVCKKFVDHYVIDENETKYEVEKCEKYYILDSDKRKQCVDTCRMLLYNSECLKDCPEGYSAYGQNCLSTEIQGESCDGVYQNSLCLKDCE